MVIIFQQGNEKIAPLKEFVTEPLEELRSGFGQERLSKAVLDLFIPMLNEPALLLEVLRKTRSKAESAVGYVGGNATTLLLKADSSALEKQDCSQMILSGADLSNASLRYTDFTQADLAESVITNVLGEASSLAFSPDGQLIAVGDSNGSISIWNSVTRQKVKTLVGHTNWIHHLDFSPQGNLLASANSDKIIRLWNIETGQCLNILQAHNAQVL